MGSWTERTRSKAAAGRAGEVVAGGTGGPTSAHKVQIDWEEELGSETDRTTQGSSAGK